MLACASEFLTPLEKVFPLGIRNKLAHIRHMAEVGMKSLNFVKRSFFGRSVSSSQFFWERKLI